MERDDPKNPGSRGEPRRPFVQRDQGWQAPDDEETQRLRQVNPLWPPDARPPADSRVRPPQPFEGYPGQPSPPSPRRQPESGGAYGPVQRGGAEYPGSGTSRAGAPGRSGYPTQREGRPSPEDISIQRTAALPSYPRSPEHDGAGFTSRPSGAARFGERSAIFDERTLPLQALAEDRLTSTRGRSKTSAPFQPEEATRWGVQPKDGNGAGRRRKAISKRRRVITVALLVAIALCSISSLVSGVMAASAGQNAYKHATSGLAHLRNGERMLLSLSGAGFSAATVQSARNEFVAGQNDFSQVNKTLQRIPSAAESAPFVGGQVRSVMNLSSVASNFSQIGIAGCDALAILINAFSNPFGASVGNSSSSATSNTTPPTGGLTAADLVTIQTKLATVNSLLNDSTTQINALQPSDLSFDPKIGAQLMKLKAELPTIQQDLQEAQAFMGVAGTLLGVETPTNYLVELLDSTELRPGGGFIGNIGIMTLNRGLLASLHVKDVDLLDRPFEFAGGFIPFPTQYQWFPLVSNWSVRDSNLDADFPTDAKYAETNYRLEGGMEKVQGVIAITPWLIEKALAITGPIYVPEFNETVTPANLVNLIHYHQLGPGHGSEYIPDPASLSSQRKRFTAFLFTHFMERVKAILSAKRSAFVKLAIDALATKDVQVYFNNSVAEQILQRHSYASAIEAPSTGDSLLVVDANVTGNKANNFVNFSMADKVTIDQNGTATHQLSLTYNWPKSAASEANNYGNKTLYSDYIRVYVPPAATLVSQSGWVPKGQSTAFGRRVIAGHISLRYTHSMTVTLSWRVPNAAVKAGASWTYQELIQHQAGVVWSESMQIALPSCGKVTSVTAPWLVGSGATGATFKGYLSVDRSYTTVYTCAS